MARLSLVANCVSLMNPSVYLADTGMLNNNSARTNERINQCQRGVDRIMVPLHSTRIRAMVYRYGESRLDGIDLERKTRDFVNLRCDTNGRSMDRCLEGGLRTQDQTLNNRFSHRTQWQDA
jgi:hypothetical protein